MRKSVLAMFVCVCCFVNANGWGPTGHRATGYIANRYLSKKTKAQLERILKGQSLAIASTWMDEVRSDTAFVKMNDWHWVTIPDGMKYDQVEKNPKGDLLQTIDRLITELKQKKVSAEMEAQYVKMLIHLIGDIHMPLHVGRGDDYGGNAIKVSWFRSETNLHHIWDEDMINETHLSYTELAESLDKPTEQQLKDWRTSGLFDWATESMAYRSQIYDIKNGKLGYEYSYYNFPTVRLRLLQAGVRIAQVLNDIYGK